MTISRVQSRNYGS